MKLLLLGRPSLQGAILHVLANLGIVIVRYKLPNPCTVHSFIDRSCEQGSRVGNICSRMRSGFAVVHSFYDMFITTYIFEHSSNKINEDLEYFCSRMRSDSGLSPDMPLAQVNPDKSNPKRCRNTLLGASTCTIHPIVFRISFLSFLPLTRSHYNYMALTHGGCCTHRRISGGSYQRSAKDCKFSVFF
jgi:hypothetical protein